MLEGAGGHVVLTRSSKTGRITGGVRTILLSAAAWVVTGKGRGGARVADDVLGPDLGSSYTGVFAS